MTLEALETTEQDVSVTTTRVERWEEAKAAKEEEAKAAEEKVQPLQPLDDAQRQQEIKAMQAKEYRKKLLAKQGGGKNKKDDDFDAKATTIQCVFNMPNILMGVGLLGLPFIASGWYGGIATLLIFEFVAWRTSVLIGRELNGDPRPSSFFDDSPEEKVKAAKEVKAAEEKVEKAEEKVEKAEEKFVAAHKELSDADSPEEKVKAAKEEVKAAKEKVKAAKEKVKAAEEKVEKAEEKVEKAKEEFLAAHKELSDAKAADSDLQIFTACFESAEEDYNIAKKICRVAAEYYDLAVKNCGLATKDLETAMKNYSLATKDQETETNKEMDSDHLNRMIAQSPTMKFAMSAVESIDASSCHLWDFSHPTQTTQKDRKNIRRKTAKKFNVWKENGDCQCQLSLQWGNYKQVTTSHLLKHCTKVHLKKMFEIDDINDQRNLLLLAKGIDCAYSCGRIYFEGKDDRTFVMRIFDQTVTTEPIFDGSATKIGDIEGRELMIPGNVEPPFKRLLSDHAQAAHKHAIEMGWIDKSTCAPEEYGSPLKDNILSITQSSTYDLEEDFSWS